jgi:phospholipid/cholesterol/gamma-HCH transport system ATP-binding protein
MTTDQTIIEVKNLKTYLGGNWVHQDLNLSVKRGEILGIVGGTGSGKTTLLREMLLLQQPTAGSIRVFDQDVLSSSRESLLKIQRRLGVMFQQNALFSSLTLLENVSFPLREHTNLKKSTIRELAALKILLAGLPINAANKYPAQLSGGMQKRAALARAIVLDPELIFLDEPTAGLDPDSAAAFDDLILNLQKSMDLTIVIVTHDLDTLWRVTSRVAFLGDKKVLSVDPIDKLVHNPNPQIQKFFGGPRGQVMENFFEGKEDKDHGN